MDEVGHMPPGYLAYAGNTEDRQYVQTEGTIYHDHSLSTVSKKGKRILKDCWRAEINIDGARYRHRSKSRYDCEEWLKAVRSNRIRPTDNKADWWRMEQNKDREVKVDEMIVCQAEEAILLYEYHQTGDISKINEYIVKRLLPHMTYYCCHTLQFGKSTTLVAAKQAIALLLTQIVSNKPVMSFTASCKRMLRIYKERGDFFFYDTAPEEVKLMVNGLNIDELAKVWKITKDRRL